MSRGDFGAGATASRRSATLRPLLRRQGFPDSHGAVARCGDKPGAVGAPIDSVDVILVAVQFGDFRARCGVTNDLAQVTTRAGAPRRS